MSNDVVYALTTMHVAGTMLKQGELYDANHPLVRAHPEWFSDDLLQIATRAPGWRDVPPEEPVRRGPGRPRKIETTEANIEVTT
jgi:hypothetical protein